MTTASPDLVVLAVADHLRARGHQPRTTGGDIRAAAEAAEKLIAALGVTPGAEPPTCRDPRTST